MTQQEINARCEAYEQAIASLMVGVWTDDPEEAKQGNIIADRLRKQSDRWYLARMNAKQKGKQGVEHAEKETDRLHRSLCDVSDAGTNRERLSAAHQD